MAVIEYRGGPVTARYLERKTKADLAYYCMELLGELERLKKELEEARRAGGK